MNQKSNIVYFEHMKDAIKRIQRHLRGTNNKSSFLKNEKVVDAVTCQLMILGEAANNIDQTFQDENPEIPWHQIIGMRNQLIHGYAEIDLARVWKTCRYDLVKLEKQIETIIE